MILFVQNCNHYFDAIYLKYASRWRKSYELESIELTTEFAPQIYRKRFISDRKIRVEIFL